MIMENRIKNLDRNIIIDMMEKSIIVMEGERTRWLKGRRKEGEGMERLKMAYRKIWLRFENIIFKKIKKIMN